jgi:hypothetical protein
MSGSVSARVDRKGCLEPAMDAKSSTPVALARFRYDDSASYRIHHCIEVHRCAKWGSNVLLTIAQRIYYQPQTMQHMHSKRTRVGHNHNLGHDRPTGVAPSSQSPSWLAVTVPFSPDMKTTMISVCARYLLQPLSTKFSIQCCKVLQYTFGAVFIKALGLIRTPHECRINKRPQDIESITTA